MKARSAIGVMSLQAEERQGHPRSGSKHWKLEESRGTGTTSEHGEETNSVTPAFWTASPQNCERIHLYCLGPPSVW